MVRINEVKSDKYEVSVDKLLSRYFHLDGVRTIRPDGKIDVEGSCDLLGSLAEPVKEMPLQFGTVTKHFHCSFTDLTTLKGSPEHVGMNFSCGSCALTSLVGSPLTVGGEYLANENTLASLEGLPNTIGGAVWITWNADLPLLRLVAHRKTKLWGDDRQVIAILHKWCQDPGGLRSRIVGCQSELIAAGFEGNAKW